MANLNIASEASLQLLVDKVKEQNNVLSGLHIFKGIDGKDGIDGKNGVDGTDGVDGKSAFELAQAHGFEGTEEEWLASLKGKDGTDGTNGNDGADGKDAEILDESGNSYIIKIVSALPENPEDYVIYLVKA